MYFLQITVFVRIILTPQVKKQQQKQTNKLRN